METDVGSSRSPASRRSRLKLDSLQGFLIGGARESPASGFSLRLNSLACIQPKINHS